MQALELKIPPVVVVVLAAVAMWGIAQTTPRLAVAAAPKALVAAAVAIAGASVCVLGVLAFRRACTTVDPRDPARSAALVCEGVYRATRNPMYVGMALLLLAWGIVLASPVAALAGPTGFAAFITRFQIVPEERMLARRFGQAYADYRSRVRRWL